MNLVGSRDVRGKIRRMNVTLPHKTAQPKAELTGQLMLVGLYLILGLFQDPYFKFARFCV
jgi:hypothetical protein